MRFRSTPVLTGFVNPDDSVWGRPIDVAETQDGALIVSDEGGGVLWRVRWTGRP
jgi:glucose/arabinose dehydrogenase